MIHFRPAFHCAAVAVAAVAGLLLGVATAGAQTDAPARSRTAPPLDVVTVQLDNGGRIAQRGTVLKYDGRHVRIQIDPARPPLSYPAEQVVSVETSWSAPFLQGRALFAGGRFNEAAEAFHRALIVEGAEPHREWVRRETLAQLVRCALATGGRATARQRFDLLVENDRHTRYMKLIPLEWGSAPLAEGETADARRLLEKPSDAARLMGASALLFDATYGSAAEIELRRLLSSPDPHVGALAAAQQWRRLRLETALRPEQLDEWQRRVEALPAELRGGPYYVLGRARFDRREFDRAATFLLWSPLVTPEDAHLASRAGVEAAEALSLMGRKGDAVRVCRDVLHRFAHTPFAQDARGMIESLTKEGEAS